MELKSKYQYTYFIYPYVIDEYKYKKYILNLLKNKNIHIKNIEQEKDIEIYNYFLPSIKKYMFSNFEFTKKKINNIKKLNIKTQANILSQYNCVMFEYELNKSIQGKADLEKCIFFEIQKIEVICFNTGICFLNIKTNVEGSNNFSDILDFNYKFKDIQSNNSKLKDYENIKIQTSTFKDIESISQIITTITGNKNYLKDLNIHTNKFFTYSYVCLEQDMWNKENDFEKIEKDYIKYIEQMPSNCKINYMVLEEITKGEYIKIGANNLGVGLITSAVELENYTKLPYEFENQYLYTYIIALYKKIYLEVIKDKLENYKNIYNIIKKTEKFEKSFEQKQITEDKFGNIFFEYIQEKIDYRKTFDEINKIYEITNKNKIYKKFQRKNIILKIVLLISIIVNIILLWKLN